MQNRQVNPYLVSSSKIFQILHVKTQAQIAFNCSDFSPNNQRQIYKDFGLENLLHLIFRVFSTFAKLNYTKDLYMNSRISPLYQMTLIQNINDRLFELFGEIENIENYLNKWHEVYDCYGDNENFYFHFNNPENTKIDVEKTLHNIDGELLLKIAIDLGIETPDYIPSIPMFKNELKSSYEMASQTFDKAFKDVETDPALAIGLANSALESIIKEILKDDRIKVPWNERNSLSSLIKPICKAFEFNNDNSSPEEIKTIANSLMSCCKAIEDLRSDKTLFHGKTANDYVVKDPLYAYFVVNAISTIGLFFLNYYKLKYPKTTSNTQTSWENELPF